MTFKKFYLTFVLTVVALAILGQLVPWCISSTDNILIFAAVMLAPTVAYGYVYFIRLLWSKNEKDS